MRTSTERKVMNRIKTAATSTKKFVNDHRVAIAVIITSITCLVMHIAVIRGLNDFLEEKGLLDEFYPLEEV